MKVERVIRQYKEKIIEYNGAVDDKQVKFATELVNRVADKNKNDKVEVIMARCGMGKSVIVNTILDNIVNKVCFGKSKDNNFTGEGAIVITDSLDRLEGISEKLENCCYLMKNDLDIPEIENRKNFQEKIQEQFKFPILLMTTQRYFQMSENDREFMYTWAKGERKIAFIDEKPILTNEVVIDEKFLSEIRIAIHECYENNDKNYLLETFTKIYNDIDYIRNVYSNEYEIMWLKNTRTTLLVNEDEDVKFFAILEKNVSSKIYNDVLTLKRIYTDGCLFVSKKNKSQDNIRQFIVLNNNTDKFDTDKCKYYILDATAKFDVDYMINKDIFEKIEIDDKKQYSDINIYHVPFSTSKNNLITKANAIPMISQWINKSFAEKCLVATYGKKSGLYQKFDKELVTNNLAYFGAIKGRNDWSNLHDMIQIGFNRQSDVSYLLTYIYLKNKADEWNTMNNEDILDDIDKLVELDKGLFSDIYMSNIMMLRLVVDTVQNVMRIKCREFSNKEQCHIYIVAGSNKEDDFYRCTINRIRDVVTTSNVFTVIPDDFEEFKIINRNTSDGKETNGQKILNWVNNLWDGKQIKTKDMLSSIGLTQKQFDKAKEKNEALKNLLSNYQVKRGIYAK